MRLRQRVLSRLKQTKRPQHKFVPQLLGLLLLLPGHATFRNFSRSRPYHERTFSRWYARDFDGVWLNKAAITEVVSPAHAPAWVMDASFVPTSGKPPSGLDRFWKGSQSRPEKGREISPLAWRDITHNCAYCLSGEQTPPTGDIPAPEATRMAVYLDHLPRVVTAHDLNLLRSVGTDGYDSKQTFVAGVCAWGLPQLGKLRADANLRYLYQGPQRPGPGRQKTDDGKGNWSDLSRFEPLAPEDEPIVLYQQVVNQGQVQRHLQVVVVVDTQHNRYAVLFSTAVGLNALTLSRYYTARFHIAFLFRDAKQFTGLSDCQARSQATRDFPFNASLSAVPLAKLEARQQHGNCDQAFSMARLKRRACNQHLIDRICEP